VERRGWVGEGPEGRIVGGISRREGGAEDGEGCPRALRGCELDLLGGVLEVDQGG
jgi:hypothetical protein